MLAVVQDHEFDVTVLNEEFINYLQNVQDEFDRRSLELRTENYRHVQFPYAFDALALICKLMKRKSSGMNQCQLTNSG